MRNASGESRTEMESGMLKGRESPLSPLLFRSPQRVEIPHPASISPLPSLSPFDARFQ
jgi:hypothetical protein